MSLKAEGQRLFVKVQLYHVTVGLFCYTLFWLQIYE